MIRKSTSDVVAVDIVPVPYCEVGATGNHLATQVAAQSDSNLGQSVLTVSPAPRGPPRPMLSRCGLDDVADGAWPTADMAAQQAPGLATPGVSRDVGRLLIKLHVAVQQPLERSVFKVVAPS